MGYSAGFNFYEYFKVDKFIYNSLLRYSVQIFAIKIRVYTTAFTALNKPGLVEATLVYPNDNRSRG